MSSRSTGEPADPDGFSVEALVKSEFAAEVVYLDTASIGLPARRSLDALEGVLEAWRVGRASPADYDASIAESRKMYAAFVGVQPANVALANQVSVFAGLVAAALPNDSEVIVVEGEFTSIVFPFMAQGRGVEVKEVPFERLAESITERTTLVAVAAVQSADGRLVDLQALEDATRATETEVLLDLTQAVGWLRVDASRFAYTVCAGYKWLLAPRGTCFFTVQPEFVDGLVPNNAGWYAGEYPWDSIYGGPIRLASDARRFDVSPAWHSWVAQAPALELLTEVGPKALHDHAVGLANRFRAGIDWAPSDSAIVSLGTDADVGERLARAGIIGSTRVGRLRLSFHLNNTLEDADRAVEALSDVVHP